ncbi:MAG: protocatechuate 3,4-dioxygenase [Sphingopyxis sp.]|nr:protocatechuate 3,4-dioxygenase [Sphingopyxis sp.]
MTDPLNRLSRRAFGVSVLAFGALSAMRVAAAELKPTPTQTLGPFYPIERLAEDDADLTWIKGHAKRAEGSVIQVKGRVLDRYGHPVSGARLEIWQCNSLGRYAHANDVSTMPLDPNFQGYASIRTSAKGEWRITTIKPAAYDSPIGRRTPHIHFDVQGKSHRLTTQMYFSDDDATNSKDLLYQELGGSAERTVAKLGAPGQYDWNVILMDGV